MLSKLKWFWNEKPHLAFLAFALVVVVAGVWLGLEHTELRWEERGEADRACQVSRPESCVGSSQHVYGMSTRSSWLCACPCDGGEAVLHQAPRG